MKQAITTLLFILFGSNVWACYCSKSDFKPNDFFNSKYIFEGEVTKVERCRVYFKIIKNIRGNLSNEEAYTDTKCDYYCGITTKFEVGQKWIMYGSSREGVPFYTDDCSRSSLISKTEDYEIGQINLLSTINGYTKLYSKDSILLAEGVVKKQKREGEWKIYDKHGFPKQIATFKNNKIVKRSIVFHTPWNREMIRYDSVPDYIGKVKSITLYNENHEIDLKRLYDENGVLYAQQLYKNGKAHGHHFSSHYSCYYIDGKKNGKYWIKHYRSDQIKIEGEFIMGKPVGAFNYYDRDGHLICKLEDEYLSFRDVLDKIKNNR